MLNLMQRPMTGLSYEYVTLPTGDMTLDYTLRSACQWLVSILVTRKKNTYPLLTSQPGILYCSWFVEVHIQGLHALPMASAPHPKLGGARLAAGPAVLEFGPAYDLRLAASASTNCKRAYRIPWFSIQLNLSHTIHLATYFCAF